MLKYMMVAVMALLARCAGRPRLVGLANIAEGTHEGNLTKLTDAAITTRFLLGKFGTDAAHIAVSGASDVPAGVITDEAAAAEDPVNVALFGCASSTLRGVASEAIDAGEKVYTAANGKLQDEPTGAGTYYEVGTAISTAAADGDEIEFDPCTPRKFVVSG